MNNLVKGILLGGATVLLTSVVYKNGYERGKLIGKQIGEIDAITNILCIQESLLEKEAEK